MVTRLKCRLVAILWVSRAKLLRGSRASDFNSIEGPAWIVYSLKQAKHRKKALLHCQRHGKNGVRCQGLSLNQAAIKR